MPANGIKMLLYVVREMIEHSKLNGRHPQWEHYTGMRVLLLLILHVNANLLVMLCFGAVISRHELSELVHYFGIGSRQSGVF